MSLTLTVEKKEDTSDYCVYAFGAPDTPMGRVRLQKASGDIELLDLPEAAEGPNPRFYLAQLVPRLHEYHDQSSYPDTDRWSP